MPKKQKKKRLDNRLEKLFDEIKQNGAAAPPEERAADRPSSPPASAAKKKTKGSRAPGSGTGTGLLSGPLTVAEPRAIVGSGTPDSPAAMALAFRIAEDQWATLQIVDEEKPRVWDSEEQALVRQVADQLSLALENARLFQETQEHARELSVLNEMGRALTSLLDAEAIIERIYEYASRLLDTTNFYVALYDAESDMVSFPLAYEGGKRQPWQPRQAGNGLTEYIIRTRQSLLIEDNVVERLQELGIDVIGATAVSWLGVPMLVGEKPIGVIAVQDYERPRAYDEHTRNLLESIASQAAIALENARLFQVTRRRSEELAAINEIIASASQSLDLDEILETVLEQLVKALDMSSGLANIADENGILQLRRWYNLPQPLVEHALAHGLGNTPCEYVYETGQSLALDNLDDLPPGIDASGLKENGLTVYLGAPIEARGNILGTFCILNDTPIKLTDEMLWLVQTIGRQVGFAVENARLFQQTEQNAAELRALFAAMTDVIIVYDKDGRYVRIAPTNPSRLFRPPDDMLGKTIQEVLPPEHHKPFMEAIQKALATGENVNVEYPLEIEGTTYWFYATVSKLDEEHVFWVARDITERKHAEERLQRQRDYLETAAEISRLITSTLNVDTLLKQAVNLIQERFGYYHVGIFIVEGFNAILAEATGEAGEEMKRHKHSLAVGSNSIVGKVTATGEPLVVNNTAVDTIHRPNPLLPETRAEAAIPLRIGERVLGAIDIQATEVDAFIPEDIAILQSLADQIAVAIDNARSYEVAQQSVREMRELDRLKSQFLANMSHELRTPLNSIIGFSRVILKGIDGPITELQQQDLTAIYNAGQHLLGLINDILDLSRIEAGKMELTFDEVNLAELINSVMSTATGLIKDKPIELRTHIAPNLPPVYADAMRVRQVLLNLLSNAAKFTEQGWISVEANVRPGPGGQPEVIVSVTDTGPGIAPEDQEKLFQPFSQVDSSPTRKTGGSGLGLSISRHLVEMHGGRIGVHSAPGKGSTFYFTLPLSRDKESPTASTGRIILAIDDDQRVIKLYERYLQPQDYEIVALTDPSQAVERARQIKPFAITLDIMMPGYDGWQVLNDLKANPETRDIPVIICSIVDDREKGFSLGAADYLVKPILEDDLLGALDRLNGDGSIREVLVIDDDPDDLRLIGRLLNENGRYKAILTNGGKQGWEAITSRAPHAIILDLFMPDMDGFTILEKLRTTPNLQDIPVIVITGGDLTAEQREQLQQFGQRLLQKGALSEKQLLSTLERALKRINPRA